MNDDRLTATQAQERLNRRPLTPEQYQACLAEAERQSRPIVEKLMELHRLWCRPQLIVQTATDGSWVAVESRNVMDAEVGATMSLLREQIKIVYEHVFAGDIPPAFTHIATE